MRSAAVVNNKAEGWLIVRGHERERQQLIEQIKTLASLIEQAKNSSQINKYIEELDKLNAKLASLGEPKQQD